MNQIKSSRKRVWVDATLVLKAGIDTATGIQRVETGLCSFALKNPEIGLAYYNKENNCYYAFDEDAAAYLSFILKNNATKQNCSYLQNVRRNFSYLGFQIFNNRSKTTKRISIAIAGKSRFSKLLYPFAYIIIFFFLYFVKLFIVKKHKFNNKEPEKTSILLTSFAVKQNVRLDEALKKFGAIEAHIFYDIIPILYPELLNTKLARAVTIWMSRALINDSPIIAISETVAQEVMAWNEQEVKADRARPVKACKLTVPFDINSDELDAVAELKGKRFAMFVSSIDVRKGQDHLVRVWKHLFTQFDASLLPDLVLIGRKGSGWSQLNAELQTLGPLREKIHVLSDVGDAQLRWCFKNASFSLFPSIAEGWGLGVSESLAYGLPVIHSDIPVLHEVSQGLMPVAAPRDIETWASKIAVFLNEPSQLAALRTKIADHYEPGHPDDFARCVMAYLEVVYLGLNKSQETAPKVHG
jgi:glycosyltransferase involved in cell wall biosynthesis